MLSKLAIQNIRGNKGYFIAYIITLAFFCTITYQVSSLQISLDKVMSHGAQIGQFSLSGVFTYLKTFIYIIIVFFAFYIGRFFIKRRTKEIALLKTLGLSRFNIFKVFAIENVIVVASATILGLIMSILTTRLFTFLAVAMIGIDINNVGLPFMSEPVNDVRNLMIVIFIIISIIPIQTIKKVSIVQLLQEEKKPDVVDKKSKLSLILFFVFLGLMIINALFIIPNWDGDTQGTSVLLFYFLNAVFLAIYLYKGLLINYFSNYTKKHRGITSPNKIISYAHISQSSKAMAKIMSFISIITGVIIVLAIFVFGVLNGIIRNIAIPSPSNTYYSVHVEQAQKADIITTMHKADLGKVNSFDMYPYSKVKLKEVDNANNGIDDRYYKFEERSVFLIKASDYQRAYKQAPKKQYLSNVSLSKCNTKHNLQNYCQLLKNNNITPTVDRNLNKLFYIVDELNFNKKLYDPNYISPVYLVVNDNSPLLKNIKPQSLVTFDKMIKQQDILKYSNLFYSKASGIKKLVNPYLEDLLMVPLIFGSFQLTFFIFALVLLITLMVSMFFRALESLELSLKDYIIAKQMGLSDGDINKSLFMEVFVSQLLPFYFGIIVSILLARQLFASALFANYSFTEALTEPATINFIIALIIALHALVLILMMIIRYEINHIKKVK